MQVKHLAQIAPKNAVSVIVNPYDSDNLDAIEKAIKASDDTL
jgi:ribosome recycling factor